MARLSLEDRRQNFIDAAVQVVANEGVARATTRRIAEVANAPLAGLHYCFQTKEALFQAVLEASSTLGIEDGRRGISPGMGLRRGVEVVARGFFNWLRENRSMQQALFELCHWALRNPAYSHLVRDTYRNFLDSTVALLREARQEHETSIDLEMLAKHITALGDGHTLQWLALDNRFDDAIEDSIRLLQAAVVAQAPEKAGHAQVGATPS